MKTSLLAAVVAAAFAAAPAAAQVNPANDVGLPASGAGLSLNGLAAPTGGPSCPPATAVGASFSGALTQSGRIFRDGIASTCPGKAYPGIFNAATTYNYETFIYSNTGASPACVTVNFDPDAGATPCGTNAHASAYIGSYDPANQAANFVGDVGSSIAQPFAFEVPAGQNMVLAVTNTSSAAMCTFAFQVVDLPCAIGADLQAALTAAPATVAPGLAITFSASATNNGPGDAADVQLNVALGAGVAFSSASPSAGGSCTTPALGAGGNVTCTWAGSTASGTTRSVSVVGYSYNQGAAGASASASSPTSDPTPGNNSATASVTVATGGGTTPPAFIPTASTYGLAFLAVLMGLLGFAAVRRQH